MDAWWTQLGVPINSRMVRTDLLVALVTEPGVAAWEVYLPSGQCVDVWTGHPLGPGNVTVEAPIDQIPVFATSERWTDLARVFETLG
jgi:alpha-glucosidase (family GH31 glycosyl hydrolase)